MDLSMMKLVFDTKHQIIKLNILTEDMVYRKENRVVSMKIASCVGSYSEFDSVHKILQKTENLAVD